MKGITFNNLQEAKEYQSEMLQQGYLTKRTKIDGGYVVYITGENPRWKNAPNAPVVENLSDALKDEDESP